MGKGTTFENDLLKLIFNGTPIANLADNAAASPVTNLYISLHTANPESGSQVTSETAYAGYVRLPVLRSTAGWTVTGGSVSPVSPIEFGECSATPGATITHAAIGTSVSGTGKILYAGVLSVPVTMALGVAPRIKTTTTITED